MTHPSSRNQILGNRFIPQMNWQPIFRNSSLFRQNRRNAKISTAFLSQSGEDIRFYAIHSLENFKSDDFNDFCEKQNLLETSERAWEN